ncbi:MAG: HupE/UreJ family protein [Acidobacteriia bacterium]|nr:HupE/UreJ family protein [Terriglobia bacterium]
MRRSALIIAAVMLLLSKAGFAHRIDEYLQATIFSLGQDRVQASMRLIPGIQVSPSVIAGIDANGDGAFSDAEEQAYAQRVLNDLTVTIDGKHATPRLISWSFPQAPQLRDGLGKIHIEYAIDLPSGGLDRSLIVANHHQSATSVYLMNVLIPQDRSVRIVAQKRNERQSLYELDYEQVEPARASQLAPWNTFRVWLNGGQVASLFRLGMRHIAEGTDHLLFLLVLLLLAPLLVAGGRWGSPVSARQSLLRILGIVTAFTVGHSITLSLAAFGVVSVPARPVEVLIAVSIFVSAVHAFRPIFPGREALIAAFFGLIHGLAFAATLDRLGLGRWERLAGIFAFNLGIETMQMLVVAAILPSLMLMSRTRAYPVLRIGGAIFAGAASTGWIIERLFDINANIDILVNAFARHSLLIAINLFAVSLTCKFLLSLPRRTA